MILLDTCGLLALQDAERVFSPATRSALEASGSRVFISAISAFEIGQKQNTGRLTLPCQAGTWFQCMLEHHQLEEIPISSILCLAATALPRIHKDPFDRILIATALELNLTILTSDRTIAAYPGIKTLW